MNSVKYCAVLNLPGRWGEDTISGYMPARFVNRLKLMGFIINYYEGNYAVIML